MPRVVADETLDHLAPEDPAAQRSRRDLVRVHHAMGTRSIMRSGWRALLPPPKPSDTLHILELGAGDGRLLLGMARALAPTWPHVRLTLLDRQPIVSPATLAAYAALGWEVQVLVIDVLDWVDTADPSMPLALPVARPRALTGAIPDAIPDAIPGSTPDAVLGAMPEAAPAQRWDLITTTLFLHHFEGAALQRLLAAVAARTHCFFACEPRRGRLALAGSHLIGLIGANAVTREDAVLSVHAGFRGNELTAHWPEPRTGWQLREYQAGLFSHCFSARQVGATSGAGR